jgi:hypothetical protein
VRLRFSLFTSNTKKKENIMKSENVSSLRRQFIPLLFTVCLTVTAQAAGNKPDPTTTFKVPPLPTGSAQAVVKAGMSKKDWEDAYKESGRPPFPRNSVKRTGGTVERD